MRSLGETSKLSVIVRVQSNFDGCLLSDFRNSESEK